MGERAPVDVGPDAAAWVNDALLGATTLSELEESLTGVVQQLDSAQAETSNQVESLIDEITRSVPRLSFDLQLMREHALLLRFTLDKVRNISHPAASASASNDASHVRNASTATVASNSSTEAIMDELAEISLVKTRMEAALAVLREAESWSTLDSEVTALIADKSYERAAARLSEASRSMAVFQNTPEYESRRALMLSLQNGLEASLSNSLVKAIADRDVKACKSYFGLFGLIQREGEFRNYYYGSRRNPLVQEWANTPQSVPAFIEYLPHFFRNLLNMLTEELAYLPAIFPDPQHSLAALIQSTIDALVPSFHQRLSEVTEATQQPLVDLIAAYHNTEEFALAARRLLSDLAAAAAASVPAIATPGADFVASPGSEGVPPLSASTGLPVTPGSASSPASAKERRLSKRLSVSTRRLSGRSPSLACPSVWLASSTSTEGSDASNAKASAAANLPEAWEVSLFEPFLDAQVDYATLEEGQLEAALSKVPWSDPRTLSERIQGGFAESEAALSRCVAFTHGFGVSSWADLVDAVLSRYIHSQSRQIANISTESIKAPQQGEALEGLDYSSEDWAAFQNGTKLLGVCRGLDSRFDAFERKVKTRLGSVARDIHGLERDPSYTIPGTTTGALSLLKQSTLMSNDLVDLLGQVGDLSSQRHLFHHVASSLGDLTRASQMLLHNNILRPLKSNLAQYASLPVWAQVGPQKGNSIAAFDFNIPTFSLSPTDEIAQLGEGLFNLPRLFEVYADDDALGYSIETLPNIGTLFLDQLQQAPPHSVALPATAKRQSSFGDHLLSTSHPSGSQPQQNQKQDLRLSAEEVVAAWLASLTNTILKHLTESVLPGINSLSAYGAQQLASDLGHIGNVAKAFDVESEQLERWRECSEMSDAEGKKVLHDNSEELDSTFLRLAQVRGWR